MAAANFLSPDKSDIPFPDHGPQRVLVCSDCQVVTRTLTRLCHAERLDVRVVTHPDSLLRHALALEPDLVLLDEQMPEVSGLELCGELRASEGLEHTPVMLISSEAPEPNRIAAGLLSGADDCVSLHELWRAELLARIRVQLRNRRYRSAITRLRHERNVLRTRASTDSLTGALGRRALEDAVQAEHAAANAFAVLFVDIDHFKSVNDTYGHQVGDAVLRRVATTLQDGRRESDLCGRYGGEEFVILLKRVNATLAVRAAERHRQRIRGLEFSAEGGPAVVTVSVGVAAFDPLCPDETPALLLRRADLALYEAKRTGRDRVVLAPRFTETEQSERLARQGERIEK